MTKIRITAGDDHDFGFTVYKGDSVTPEDLTGATFSVLAKRSRSDLDAAAVIVGTAAIDGDAALGKVFVSLPGSATSALTSTEWLWFDVQMTLDSKKRTVLDGMIVVEPQIVRA